MAIKVVKLAKLKSETNSDRRLIFFKHFEMKLRGIEKDIFILSFTPPAEYHFRLTQSEDAY